MKEMQRLIYLQHKKINWKVKLFYAYIYIMSIFTKKFNKCWWPKRYYIILRLREGARVSSHLKTQSITSMAFNSDIIKQ